MAGTYTHTEPHHYTMSLQECCYCSSTKIRKLIFSNSHVIHTCYTHLQQAARDIKTAFYKSGIILSSHVLEDELFHLIPNVFQGVCFAKDRVLIKDESGWNIPIEKVDGSTPIDTIMGVSVSELIHLLPSDQKETPLLPKFLEKLEKGFYYDEFIANEEAKKKNPDIKRPDVSPNIKFAQLPDGRIVRTFVQ